MDKSNTDTLNKMIEYWQNNELVLTTINRSEYEDFTPRASHVAFKKAKSNLSCAIDSMKNFLIEYAAEDKKREEMKEVTHKNSG